MHPVRHLQTVCVFCRPVVQHQKVQRRTVRVGHGLDPSMDWIGLGPLFFHLYIFYINN